MKTNKAEVLKHFVTAAIDSFDPGLYILSADIEAWNRTTNKGYGESEKKFLNLFFNKFRNAKGRFVGSLKTKGNTQAFRDLSTTERNLETMYRIVIVLSDLGL